jgi:hypothetical protein
MTVTEGWFSGVKLDHPPEPSELRPELFELLKNNIALNSKVLLLLLLLPLPLPPPPLLLLPLPPAAGASARRLERPARPAGSSALHAGQPRASGQPRPAHARRRHLLPLPPHRRRRSSSRRAAARWASWATAPSARC